MSNGNVSFDQDILDGPECPEGWAERMAEYKIYGIDELTDADREYTKWLVNYLKRLGKK